MQSSNQNQSNSLSQTSQVATNYTNNGSHKNKPQKHQPFVVVSHSLSNLQAIWTAWEQPEIGR